MNRLLETAILLLLCSTIQSVHSQTSQTTTAESATTNITDNTTFSSIQTATTVALPWTRKSVATTTPTTATDRCTSRLNAVAAYDGICMDVASDESYCRCFQTMLRESRVFGCELAIVQFYRDGCRLRCRLCDGDDDSDATNLAPSTVAMLGVVVGLALCAVIIGCVLLVQKRRRFNLVAQFNPRPYNPRAVREPLADADAPDAAAVDPVAAMDDAEPAPYPPVYTTY